MFDKLKSGHWPIFLLSSISSFGNLFLPIILVRYLSTEDVGIYKIFFLHLSVIPYLFMAGGPMHSVYYWVGRDKLTRAKFLNATWVLTLFLSSLVLIVGFPLKTFIISHVNLPAQYFMILIMIGAMSCPSGHFIETSMALGKNIGAVTDTIFELIKAIGFIFISWYFKDIYYLFVFFLFFMLLKLIVTSILNFKLNQVTVRTDSEHVVRVAKYCFPIAFSGLLGFFIEKFDLLILSTQLDSTSYAYYSLGCLVIPPLYLLEMSVQKNLIPALSKYYLEGNSSESAAKYRKAVKDISYLIVPSIFGLFVFATPIVKIIYTEKYLDSVIFLKIFAFSYLLLIIPHDSVPRATGKTGWILKMYLVITPILLGAAYYAAKHYGATGVLTITLVLKFIPKYFGLRFSRLTMNWSWKDMFPLKHLGLFIIICALLSVISLLLEPFFTSDILWFLVCGSAFGVIYLFITNLIGNKGRYESA